MKFPVTVNDWFQGEPQSRLECPVSLSLHRVFPEADIIITTSARVRVRVNGGWLAYRVDKTAEKWIRRFDVGRDCPVPVGLEVTYLGEGMCT